MAKIFRFSGYLVDADKTPYSYNGFKVNLIEPIMEESECVIFQQLHVEESEEFELDGEDKEDCDLALLIRHFKKDNSNTQFDRPLPVAGEKYKHFKLGKIVTVIGISRHTETEEITVVYEYEGTIWNRPLEMFMSEVDKEKYPNVSQKYRFEKVGGRMTLDEAIAKYNKLANNDRTCYPEEAQQLAEWLEELKELREYKKRMEVQYLDDISNPLEPLKLANALKSEIFKYEYRKEHKPQDINPLDYTVMYALKHCLEEQLKAGEDNV